MLESSTTREMTNLLKPWRNAIGTVSEALRANARYQDENARDVIAEEADRRGRMATAFLLSFVAEFVDEAKTLLLADGGLWKDCDEEWGQGIKSPRYKERVAQHFEQWGIDKSPALMNTLADLENQADADDSGILRSLIDK